VLDPDGVESSISEAKGLGLLDVDTVMHPAKDPHQVRASLQDAGMRVAPGCDFELTGYEIHMGSTTLGSGAEPFARLLSRSGITVDIADGAVAPDGRVFGTYMHGIFDNQAFRTALLNRIRREKGMAERSATEAGSDPFDQLAAHLEQHLDMARIFSICGMEKPEQLSEVQ
jgi:adenosylcobyric acid synthase